MLLVMDWSRLPRFSGNEESPACERYHKYVEFSFT